MLLAINEITHNYDCACARITTTYRVIHKVRHVSIETSINGEVTVFSVIVVEIKEIRHSLRVVDLTATFRFFARDHLNQRTFPH